MTERDRTSPLRGVLDRAATVRVRNVLNPLLWLVAVATPVSFVAAWAAGFDSAVGLLLVIVGAAPIISAIIAYAAFAMRDPDRLQSEEFRLRQRAMQLLYRIGGATEIVDVATQQPQLEIEHRQEGSKE